MNCNLIIQGKRKYNCMVSQRSRYECLRTNLLKISQNHRYRWLRKYRKNTNICAMEFSFGRSALSISLIREDVEAEWSWMRNGSLTITKYL